MEIRNFTLADYAQLSQIYLQGIATGHATFQTCAPGWDAWDLCHLKTGRLAAFEQTKMLGWAALSPVSSRCVYAGVAEVSIYINEACRGKGIGKKLLAALIAQSEEAGIWTLQSGIFPENKSSIRLHERCGFRYVGYREKIGTMNGVWRDNIIMERRSKTVGI